jgi:hypothetical protein
MANISRYILLSFILILVGAKYYHLTKKGYTPIDSMSANLAPFKKILPINSSIGFYNNGLADSVKIIYSYAVFVLHPITVTPGNADTMLTVVDKRYATADFKGYKTVLKNEDDHFIYSLIKKDK